MQSSRHVFKECTHTHTHTHLHTHTYTHKHTHTHTHTHTYTHTSVCTCTKLNVHLFAPMHEQEIRLLTAHTCTHPQHTHTLSRLQEDIPSPKTGVRSIPASPNSMASRGSTDLLPPAPQNDLQKLYQDGWVDDGILSKEEAVHVSPCSVI